MTISSDENKKEEVRFDPDFSPQHLNNQAAAKAANVKYDRNKNSYTDEDGCLIYDRLGQRY